MLIESVEAFAPETAIEIEPFGGCLQALRLEPAAAELAVALLAHEGGCLQHAQMPRDRRQRDGEGACQLRHRRFARGETLNDGAPGGVGERRKGQVEAYGRVHRLADRLINIDVK